jgi:hypothetical protein
MPQMLLADDLKTNWVQVLEDGRRFLGRAECVTLNTAEQRLAAYLAEARTRRNRTEGVRDRLRTRRDPREVELEGMSAEIAFCKSQNIYPDLIIGRQRPHYDCLTSDGIRVDVKSVTQVLASLKAMPGKVHVQDVDAFVLVQGVSPTYHIIGWAAFTDLVSDARITDFGYGPAYAMEWQDLQPMDTLSTAPRR